MLDVMVGALLVAAAGLLGWARHRGTRRADLPGLLQGIGLALTVLAAAALLTVDPGSPATLLLLVPAAGALVAAGVCRVAEEAVHAALVERGGGPVLGPSRAALPELSAAATLLVVGLITVATGRNGVGWALLLGLAAAGPLLVVSWAQRVAERRRSASARGYEHELALWAWGLSDEGLLDLEARLENARLARMLGVAPRLGPVGVPVADPTPLGSPAPGR